MNVYEGNKSVSLFPIGVNVCLYFGLSASPSFFVSTPKTPFRKYPADSGFAKVEKLPSAFTDIVSTIPPPIRPVKSPSSVLFATYLKLSELTSNLFSGSTDFPYSVSFPTVKITLFPLTAIYK